MKGRLRKLLQKLQFPLILGLILALIVSTNLFFACTKQLSASTDQPIILRLATPSSERDALMPLIEEFQENNKNIKIVIVKNNTDNTDSLKEQNRKSLIGKTEEKLDLIYMDSVWLTEFASQGWLMELTDSWFNDGFKRDELEWFKFKNDEDFLKEMYYGKGLYRIPFRTDVGVLFYRKDWLKDKNLSEPKTFDDLNNISQQLKQNLDIKYPDMKYSYLWQDKFYEGLVVTFFEVLYNYGGFWIDRSNKTVGLSSNSDGVIEAIEFLRNTYQNLENESTYENNTSRSSRNSNDEDATRRPKDEDATRRAFENNEAVSMRNWPKTWREINNDEPFSDKFGITSVVSREKDKPGYACRGGWGFGIANNSLYKKEALLAIKFFTSAASQQKFTLAYGSLPSRRSLFFDPKIVASNSYYPMFLDILENHSVPRPFIREYTKASCILQNSLIKALDPKENDYKTVMDEAAQETQDLLNTGKYTGRYNNCREENG